MHENAIENFVAFWSAVRIARNTSPVNITSGYVSPSYWVNGKELEGDLLIIAFSV